MRSSQGQRKEWRPAREAQVTDACLVRFAAANARADKLSTEFMVDSGEFDEFSLAIAPVSLGVPMRELKVSNPFPLSSLPRL